MKWGWVDHTPRKPEGTTEKESFDWNPQRARRRGRSRKLWKRTVQEEALTVGKTWNEGNNSN